MKQVDDYINGWLDYLKSAPKDYLTRKVIQDNLQKEFPEAEWRVIRGIRENTIMVLPKFASPQEETYYRLKWN